MTPRAAQTQNVSNLIFDRTEPSYDISSHVSVRSLLYTTGHRDVAPGDIPPLAENGSECERLRETVCA